MNGGATKAKVSLESVTKLYPVFLSRRQRLRALLGRKAGLGFHAALKNVTFSALPGEALGVIGENGAGKSTLLRIVAGIGAPDQGKLQVEQPVGALLELGLGFHPDFSGRENARLYAALKGVPFEELEERLDAVFGFSELAEAIDQPVRTYSSGMVARLAFAVAAQLDPAVLVVDEALAVGDEAFQRKCIRRMRGFLEEGKTVLFCSHAMYQVVGFCQRALWLHHGEVKALGPASEVAQEYQGYLRMREPTLLKGKTGEGLEVGSGRNIRLELNPSRPLRPPEDLELTVVLEGFREPLHLAVEFRDQSGVTMAVFATAWDALPPLVPSPVTRLALHLPSCPLARSPLDILVHVADETGLKVLHTAEFGQALRVEQVRWEPGLVKPTHRWEIG